MMRFRSNNRIPAAILSIMIIGHLLLALAGCHLGPRLPKTNTHSLTSHLPGGPGTTPAQFKGIAGWLEFDVILGIFIVAAAVAFFLVAPEDHKISFALAGGGGSLAFISLFVRVSLWAFPWFFWGVLGVFGLAVVVFAIEVYVKVKEDKPTSFSQAVADIPGAIEKTVESLIPSRTPSNAPAPLPAALGGPVKAA